MKDKDTDFLTNLTLPLLPHIQTLPSLPQENPHRPIENPSIQEITLDPRSTQVYTKEEQFVLS